MRKRRERSKIRKPKKEDAKPHFMHKSKSRPGELVNQSRRIFEKKDSRAAVFTDSRVYFVISFSDSTNWPDIRDAISAIAGQITKVIDDKTLKIGIKISQYNDFVLKLHNNYKVIESISETTLEDRVKSESLLASLTRNKSADEWLDVSMTIFDASGLSYSQRLQSDVNHFLREGNRGSLEPIYLASTWGLYEVKAEARAIEQIQDSIGTVETIEEIPDLMLVPSGRRRHTSESMELASIVAEADAGTLPLPYVCAIDSGVNKSNQFLRPYLGGLLDLVNSKGDCSDGNNHGSLVAGLIIYGGSLEHEHSPVAKVIMVKGFAGRLSIDRSVPMIEKAMAFVGSKTRVFNLSCAMSRPHKGLTESLNQLVFDKNIVVVSAAGNIDLGAVKDYLNNGDTYPNYQSHHLIFHPGDASNGITVGSYAPKASETFRGGIPSPFTPIGNDPKAIKPDLLAEGGNINAIRQAGKISEWDTKKFGVRSASSTSDTGTEVQIGSSFATPVVASMAARIIYKYPGISPFLVKAIILASCTQLTQSGSKFGNQLQGWGIPDIHDALSSSESRFCYTLDGAFDGKDSNDYHEYQFYIPSNADKFSIVFAGGKPAWSKGWFHLRLVKPGVQESLVPQPEVEEINVIGDPETRKHINSTNLQVFSTGKGGKGWWSVRINPHLHKEMGIGPELKYGCVIVVESLRNKNIHQVIMDHVANPPPLGVPEVQLAQPTLVEFQ